MKEKRVLVVTPRFPFDLRGACEQDRAYGVRLLSELGYKVHVIALCYKSHLPFVKEAENEYGITITPILYKKERSDQSNYLFSRLKQLYTPSYWDGAAYEYADPYTQNTVTEVLKDFKPNLVWFDYTYLWPLYHIATRAKIPIVTRSINFEPDHFFNKTKKNIYDRIRYRAKLRSEKKVIQMSDHIFAITPKEEKTYRELGAQHVSTLPLRRLSILIGKNAEVQEKTPLNVFFMGSNYSVHHMLQALNFILKEVNPLIQQTFPGKFLLHIIGGKMPPEITSSKYPSVTFHGYVPDLNVFLQGMDIALVPSLSGEGMQQKVFEPIVRGIPTITSERALVGYPFLNGVHVHAVPKDEPTFFIDALGKLIESKERKRISAEALRLSREIFSNEHIKKIIQHGIGHPV